MAVGVGVALGLGESPLLGLLCGAISMTGGHATSAAFSPLVEDAGVTGALGIGITAATFGLVAGGLAGGPVGAVLIRRRKLKTPEDTSVQAPTARIAPTTFLSELTELFANPRRALWHLAALALSLKLGAWGSARSSSRAPLSSFPAISAR